MGTHFSGTKDDVVMLDAYIKLVRAAESVLARVYRRPELDGLTFSQFGVLEALHHLGPLCQGDLGQKILRSSGNITLVIDNLQKRGLVERRRDRADRRFVTVHLTKAGRKSIESIFPQHVENLKKEFAVLTPAQQKELGRLCRRLGLGNGA